ncbi:Protein phosphatase 2C [Cynara cardunculus var. scolymus]|uniref:protein-serine/threonine phosphatase n=1 Tax=Cynara cardunculus var. scolymus TaxID=59895 RepID=A0A103XLG3_CYNCS|nr:Protein phosphatase 2C [Cynara cardunculus var. scolymus]
MGLIEEMAPAVSVAISLTNPISKNPNHGSHLDFGRIMLLTGFQSDHATDCNESSSDLNILGVGKSGFSETIQEIGSKRVVNDDIMIQKKDGDGIISVGDRLSELLAVDSSSMSLPVAVAIKGTEKGQIVAEVISLEKETKGSAIGHTLKASVVVLADKNNHNSKGVRSVFELECVPLWGFHSVCGKRPEMEDAVAAVPQFMKIPVKMLAGDHIINVMNPNLNDLNAHFFGVYDGHGGSQVANYCRDRVHIALEEEIKVMKQEVVKGTMNETVQVQWEKAFTNCFQKVDDEVGGKASGIVDPSNAPSEPVAPETVGSTAVVALICSSHIIVANCGDSRAVLYRGKEAIALSNDHKPNREDEYARIEAAEVTFTARAREDECLILASDGLWDVISNEEACEVARKRILIWHKKNGGIALERGVGGVDPAAQAAADYLSMLALQKGSKDNISVIVVDLKSQRKFKPKT